MTPRTDSGSDRSPSDVDPVTSENRTVTILRVSAGESTSCAPQALQNCDAGGFSTPQCGHVAIRTGYGQAAEWSSVAGVKVSPYGSWESPISSGLVARTGAIWARFERPEPAEDGVYWLESRPDEGRTVLVFKPWGGEVVDAVPAGFNVRTSVHEYGGSAYFRHGTTLFFTNFNDQRLYRLDSVGSEPRPITPEPPAPKSLRYADGDVTPDGGSVI